MLSESSPTGPKSSNEDRNSNSKGRLQPIKKHRIQPIVIPQRDPDDRQATTTAWLNKNLATLENEREEQEKAAGMRPGDSLLEIVEGNQISLIPSPASTKDRKENLSLNTLSQLADGSNNV